MKRFFVLFSIFLFISCNQDGFKEHYTIVNLSGYDAVVILKIDGKRKSEFFARNDRAERSFIFERSLYAEMSFNPPQPCYIEQHKLSAKILKSKPSEVTVKNTLNKNIKISCADFALPPEERVKLLSNCIFEDKEIPAHTETEKLTVYFHKLITTPQWCSNLKIYTNDKDAQAVMSYDGKNKKFFLTIK